MSKLLLAIKNSGGNSQLVLKWFFEDVKGYALGVWRKKYRDIPEEAWEDHFYRCHHQVNY